MGACATKPKVDAGKAPAPEPENKDVDAVVAVQPEKNVEVPVVEVAGEGNQSDKGKEVVVDDDDNKADDQRVKTRSLSNLFKEKEGSESNECEKPAGEIKAPQTELETEKCIEEPQTEVPQTVVEPEKHTDKAEPNAPETESERIQIADVVPTTSETLPEEKVILPSPPDETEVVTLVEATPAADETKASEKKKEDIIDVEKTEMETPKETDSKPAAPTETSTEPAQQNDEVVKVIGEEKITS
ncbi:brain acid soluble protein 1 homolog isoform X2 [Cucurbita moschata]|uniref:Brain acid soluble protein 1 homolog isoform X2 n=1 Tax=Cucurbita moschata TaxID=3662 RepID=A0A6J1EJH9_CUCMO|nr:brain acid soluble protein 1 homolog isoform X2 [Cucurbita moschata]